MSGFFSISCVGWVFWDGQRMIRADAHSLGARKQIVGWASGESQPASAAEWDEARDAMLAALDITPDNAALQEQMGDLYVVAGRRDWADQALRLRHFGQAEAYYRKALALRPTDPQTWASLAVAYQGLGQTGAPLHQARRSRRRTRCSARPARDRPEARSRG